MIIGVDFDETLFPTVRAVLDIYNKRHATNLSFDQITTYNLYECLEAKVAAELLSLFNDKEVYENLKPLEGASSVLKSLMNQGHEVYILTATDIKNLAWKEELLQRYFDFLPTENLVRIYKKNLFRVDVLIEDCLDNLKTIVCDRIIIDTPYNRSTSADYAYDIHRVTHWYEILDVINKLNSNAEE